MKLSLAGIGFGLAAFCVAGAASAADDEPMFRKGRLVLDVMGADVPMGQPNLSYQGYVGPLTLQSDHNQSGEGANRTTSTVSAYGIQPSADYFITDHLTIGGRFGIAWEETHTYDAQATLWPTHTFSHGINAELAPRVGYAIPISGALGFWPRVSAGFVLEHGVGADSLASNHGEYVQGNFALVARLAPHILLELGPVLTYRADSASFGGPVFGTDPGDAIHTELELAARSNFRVDF